jgi:hypothetical protein
LRPTPDSLGTFYKSSGESANGGRLYGAALMRDSQESQPKAQQGSHFFPRVPHKLAAFEGWKDGARKGAEAVEAASPGGMMELRAKLDIIDQRLAW